MVRHSIISENTLLSKGLQQYLETHLQVSVDLISLDDLNNSETTIFKNVQFIWIDVITEIKNLLKLSQRILKKQPKLKVFVFGEFKDPQSIKSIFRSGISGYFSRNCCTESIKEAIQKADSSKPYVDPQMTELFMESIIQSNSQSNKDHLTKREKQILQLIVEEYTTEEIASKLFISPCTVETHRLHLIQKMGVRNMAGLVREAICGNLV